MKIIDTYADIISLLDNINGEFDRALWEIYIDKISKNLLPMLEQDSSIYDYNRDVLPVINLAMNSREKLKELHDSFLAVTKDIEKRIVDALGINMPVDIILYLGLCNGAGWAAELDGKMVVLLGVEKIIELDWCNESRMLALIYHELGHVWHDFEGVLLPETNTMLEKSVLQLYQEGIAMYFEQLMLNDFSYYHQSQYREGWLEWGLKNKNELIAEYIRRLVANESTQDFFGDWCNYQGYSDVGYFIGCEFVKSLLKKFTHKELLNLDLNTVYKEFCNCRL